MNIQHVLVPISMLVEGLRAVVALVRLLPGVDPDVRHHVAPARDHFAAARG